MPSQQPHVSVSGGGGGTCGFRSGVGALICRLPRSALSRPRSRKFGLLASCAISSSADRRSRRRPARSDSVLTRRWNFSRPHRLHALDRLGGGDDAAQIHRVAEGEVVGMERAKTPVGQHAGGQDLLHRAQHLGCGNSPDARRCAARRRAARSAARRPRGRSRPCGSARGGARSRASKRASTAPPPKRSAVTNTVCQLPVQRKVAAARCTSGRRSAAAA